MFRICACSHVNRARRGRQTSANAGLPIGLNACCDQCRICVRRGVDALPIRLATGQCVLQNRVPVLVTVCLCVGQSMSSSCGRGQWKTCDPCPCTIFPSRLVMVLHWSLRLALSRLSLMLIGLLDLDLLLYLRLWAVHYVLFHYYSRPMTGLAVTIWSIVRLHLQQNSGKENTN